MGQRNSITMVNMLVPSQYVLPDRLPCRQYIAVKAMLINLQLHAWLIVGRDLWLGKSQPYIVDCKNYFLFKRFLFMCLESEQSMALHHDNKNNSIFSFTILGCGTVFPPDLSSIALMSQLGRLRSTHYAYQ